MAKYTFGEAKDMLLAYENNFSDNSMKDFTVIFGDMEVRDGALRTTKKGGHSTALLEFANKPNFVLEADFINHQGGGGIFFGGVAGGMKKSTPEDDRANGYYAFVSVDGLGGALGCTTHPGKWSGNFTASKNGDRFTIGQDLHFYIRVSGDYIVYTISDCESKEELYRAEYRKGDSAFDRSPFETGTIAIRINNDGGVGGFTNLKIYEKKEATTFTDATLCLSEKLTARLTATNAEELVVFEKNGQGFAFGYDAAVERLVAYKYLHGKLMFLAQHAMQLTAGNTYDFCAVNGGNVLSFYFGDATWPIMEVQVKKPMCYNIGTTAPITFDIEKTELYSGETYVNPVTYGADPEILYHDGTFYLYTLHHPFGSKCSVRVRTSKNLYDWEEAGFAFEITEDSPIHYFMSPNVFYKDGWFYLLIASQFAGGYGPTEFRVFYASARSPLGPFVMNKEKPYVNTEPEIGGAPFVDDDGRVYITTVRFGGGNHIYIQELDAKDGVLEKKRDAVHCISPTEHYEIDEWAPISEGGVITKHNGYYYMMYASGHFRGHYGESYAISKDIYGPYTKYKYNEVLASNRYVEGAGDCMFVVCPDLEENYVVYHKHSDRANNKGFDRDICIDRFYFVPSEDGGPDVLRVYGPTDTPVPAPKFKKK
ncbi:MAG: family 43 glycosylhydrolase [Clostridia bacterium]|nr:family 43 glycosylhydrolase [Clostridia bacterium]